MIFLIFPIFHNVYKNFPSDMPLAEYYRLVAPKRVSLFCIAAVPNNVLFQIRVPLKEEYK